MSNKDNNKDLFEILRYKEESDTAELEIVVVKEEEEVDVRMLRSADFRR